MEQMYKLFVERARQGDESAFEALVNLYGKKVYNTACRICKNEADAEDVAQEVFLKVYRALPNFKGESSFSTFLYRVTVNACLDFVRRSGRAAAESLVRQDADGEEYEYLPADVEQTPERQSERAELRETLRRSILRLSDEHRAVILLRDVNGLSYEEIAAVLSCSVGTVKSRINRAREKLREILKKEGTFPDTMRSKDQKKGGAGR